MDMDNVITEPKDFTKSSIEEILGYFHFEYLNAVDLDDDPNKQQFYCGITGNIEENLSRHNIKGYTACGLCASFDIAAEVEKQLYKMGFYIGTPKNKRGNGGNDNSRIVYMAKMEKGFKK